MNSLIQYIIGIFGEVLVLFGSIILKIIGWVLIIIGIGTIIYFLL